jgi:hypothetical protein
MRHERVHSLVQPECNHISAAIRHADILNVVFFIFIYCLQTSLWWVVKVFLSLLKRSQFLQEMETWWQKVYKADKAFSQLENER